MKAYQRITNFIIVIILVVGCSPEVPAPTQTERISLPSATNTSQPTNTLLPSVTPYPPTATPVPPTAAATITPTTGVTDTPQVIEEVGLTASDGCQLAGWFYHPVGSPRKPIAVVLAHQLNSSSWEWRSFAEFLAQNGFAALIFDFRGQGRSSCILDFSSVGKDVQAAINFLKSRGQDRIVCMGASMGGSGCLAASIMNDLVGMVNLSGPMNIPGTRLVAAGDLENLEFPKLFMIAEEDDIPDWPTFVDDFIAMYEHSAGPKELFVYPGAAHGTGLLREEYGDEVQKTLLDFIASLLQAE